MPSLTHLLDLDQLIGTEYMAGSEELFSPDFFINYGQETTFERLYNQLEFPEYGRNLCTAYNPITTFSIIMGREWTREERVEIVKRRVAQGDFEPSIGGFTSVGVDVVRRYHNELYPSDPIHTALVYDRDLLIKLAQKNIPIMTSLRGNKQFTLDQKDGVMQELNYWEFPGARYGHARTRRKLEVLDNYGKKYRYQSIDDLMLCMDKAFESKNVFVAFKDSSLSELGKVYLKGMQAGLWNGERANDPITRYEASRVAMKLNPQVPENLIWNGKNGNSPASKYEISIMLHNANNLIPIYLETDRNTNMSRGSTIEMVYKAV